MELPEAVGRDIKLRRSLTFAQSKLSCGIQRWKMEMITYFVVLVIILVLQKCSSVPFLRGGSIQDAGQNSMVVENIPLQEEFIHEKFQRGSKKTIEPVNWLVGEEEIQAAEDFPEVEFQGEGASWGTLAPVLFSFTKKPVTLGYWNWHRRRK